MGSLPQAGDTTHGAQAPWLPICYLDAIRLLLWQPCAGTGMYLHELVTDTKVGGSDGDGYHATPIVCMFNVRTHQHSTHGHVPDGAPQRSRFRLSNSVNVVIHSDIDSCIKTLLPGDFMNESETRMHNVRTTVSSEQYSTYSTDDYRYVAT